MLARRLAKLENSPTLGLTAKINAMTRQGIDVVSFGAGEPDFPTPAPIVETAVQALREGFTRYTATVGIPSLRAAVSEKLKRDNGLDYPIENIVVSVGAKHALFNTIMACVDPGDTVLIVRPFWVSYPYMVRLAGAVPIMVDAHEHNDFVLDPSDLEKAILEHSPRALILNSPNNPTGAVYPRDVLEAIGDICVKHGVLIVSDEIYEKIVHDGEHVSIASMKQEFYDNTVTINGLSKAYCMTGWRMGYSASNKEIASAISKIQDHSTSGITSFVQKAAITALQLDDSVLVEMQQEFRRRRDRTVELLNGIPGITARSPKGAFYVMANVEKLLGTNMGGRVIEDSFTLAEVLLDEARVGVVPGTAFGVKGFIRLSYATSIERIEEGISRIRAFLS
ncbi:MAG: pyridoxal phosphate-dependent aminotransferase [Planctomycetota bacterium]